MVSLADARIRATALRAELAAGNAPQTARSRSQAAIGLTFRQATDRYISSKVSSMKNDKHKAQWRSSLEAYAHPYIGDMDVKQIDTPHVLAALEPIWKEKNETASRVRGRIERVLAWATVSRYRTGENPARWRGHLSEALVAPALAKKVTHHAALPYDELPSFINRLDQQVGVAALALKFAILTAARTGEVVGMRWREIDIASRAWIVPAERMKAGKAHRVALSSGAISVLTRMKEFGEDDPAAYVFPGARASAPLSNMAMLSTLKRMGRNDLTAHGFRSTFRDWAGHETTHAREVIEQALAHQLKDKTEAAYARGDLLNKRAALMADWSSYAESSLR